MTNTSSTSNPAVLIGIVVFFAAVIGYIVYAKIKRRNSSWSGTVIDKNMTETASDPVNGSNSRSGVTFGSRNAINRNYTLRIKSDAGAEFNWTVGEGFYETIAVGDKLSKSPGTEVPTKL